LNFFAVLLKESINSATPILLAALGGAFTYYANVFNIAMEGMMLTGAYFGVIGSYFFGSWAIGLLFAIISSIILSTLFSFFAVYLHSDEFVTGIAINMLALGGTTYLLRSTFHVKGAFISSKIISIPSWKIPFLDHIPLLGKVISGYSAIVYIGFLLAIIVDIVIFHTSFGLRLRATGEEEVATRSLGINPLTVKFISAVLSGLFCGIAGAFLSLGYINLFSENMSNGRGWISLTIIILVKARPLGILLLSLLFGFFGALGVMLQNSSIPPQFTSMAPYIATLFALYVYSKQKRKGSL